MLGSESGRKQSQIMLWGNIKFFLQSNNMQRMNIISSTWEKTHGKYDGCKGFY
jgi:hypothetical protein